MGFTVPFRVAELRVTDVAEPVETIGEPEVVEKVAAMVWLVLTTEKL